MAEPLVSCLTATHGRFSVLREALACFHLQDYENRELVILNNHSMPITCDLPKVRVYNEPGYSTLGHCRNRLLELARGELIRTWDDDDLYLPWAVRQGVEFLDGAPAFKPARSWNSRRNKIYALDDNVYEAAMTTRVEVARKYGYLESGGDEHVPLLQGIEKEGGCRKVDVGPLLASYCYRWDSGLHRISGLLGSATVEARTRAWENANRDFGNGGPLTPADVEGYFSAIHQVALELEGRAR